MANVMVRAPNNAGAARYGHAPAKGVAGLVNAPMKLGGGFGTTVMIYSEGYKDKVLAIKNDSVVLEPSSCSEGVHKKWDLDESWCDGFAIVNTDTQQAIQRPCGANQRVRLVPYDTTKEDSTVLWCSKDAGNDLSYIIERDDATLVLDTLVRGSDIVAIVSKNEGKVNQKWKIKKVP